MRLRARVLPLIGLLLLLILYAPPNVPGTAPCSQVAIGGQYDLLSFFLPPAAACPGPTFTITANPSSLTITPGAIGTSTISLTSIDNFNGTVSLSTSPPPACPSPGCSFWSVNPTSVTLAANKTATSTITINAGTSWPAPGNSANVTIYATSGTLTLSALVQFTISTAPDFIMSSNPSTQTVQPGATATSTILLASVNGFSGTVYLTTPLVPCFTYCWSINPGSVNLAAGGNATSTLTITTTTSIQPGTYSIPVGGNSGNLSHGVTVYFIVPSTSLDFAITANPNSLKIPNGSSGTSVITVVSIHGFSGAVSLQTSAPALCPGCTTWSIYPSSVTLSSNGTATSTLTVLGGSILTSGTVNVTGTSGSLTHSVTVSFTIVSSTSDFTISANPGNLTIAQGSSSAATIHLASINGFAGTVSLTASSSPSLPSLGLNPAVITLQSGGTTDSTLTVSTAVSTPAGSYVVTITATSDAGSGSISHSFTIGVTVLDPPASGAGGGGGGRLLQM